MLGILTEYQQHLITEKIYLDLDIHVLEKKIDKYSDKKKIQYLKNLLSKKFDERRNIKSELHKEQITIQSPTRKRRSIRYYYSIKLQNGGYREGELSYSDARLRSRVYERLNG